MNEQRPRIVIVQNQLGDLGGVTTFCRMLSSGLLARGYRVEVGGISPARDGSVPPYEPGVETWTLAEPVRQLATYGRFLRRQRVRRDRARWRAGMTARAAERFADYEDPTVVIFTQVHAREMLRDFADPPRNRRSFATIGQYHNSYSAASTSRDLRRILKHYRDDDRFLALTEADAVLFQRAGLNNAGYMHNPVEPPRSTAAAALDRHAVVSLGRYDDQKQLDHLVRAWSLIADRIGDWQLHLYGSGPREGAIRALIADLGLEGSVRMMGVTDDPEGALLAGSISASSSAYEGFPLALTEASMLGIPTAAYECSPGVGLIVEHGATGLLTPPNRPGALADALLQLMGDQGLRQRMGAAARERMIERFSVDTVLDRWEELFRETLR